MGDAKPAKLTLAENLRRLRDVIKTLRGNKALGAKAGIGERTAGRARRGDGNTTIENIGAIARAYKVAAWQLLVPDLDPAHPPQLMAKQPPAERSESPTAQSVNVDEPERAQVVQLLPEQIELAQLWLKLPEIERARFKRELEERATKWADPAAIPDGDGDGDGSHTHHPPHRSRNLRR